MNKTIGRPRLDPRGCAKAQNMTFAPIFLTLMRAQAKREGKTVSAFVRDTVARQYPALLTTPPCDAVAPPAQRRRRGA